VTRQGVTHIFPHTGIHSAVAIDADGEERTQQRWTSIGGTEMPALVATVGVNNTFHVGLVLTAFGFGFRHGIDWDHIAALTDITNSQDEPRRSMWFATLYALGHALIVFLLGFAAIVLAQRLPNGVDAVMERLVGATLVILGCYVLYALAPPWSRFPDA
jgi:high-affinity nickel permease